MPSATEQLQIVTTVDPTNDLLVIKKQGVATLRAIAPKDCYFAALEPVCCILRFTAGSPNTVAFIDEGVQNQHKRLNCASVTIDATKISVAFSKTFARVGAVVCNCDDAMGNRFFGVEATTTGFDIHVKDKNGTVINPLTDSGTGSLVATNNAIWVLGMMWPVI